MNLNEKQLDALLKMASKKLGTPPDVLKNQLQSGKFDSAMSHMSPQQSAVFKSALTDPKIAEKMMNTPQFQELYKKLSK
ncbi:MAG: hypothetical protein E7509_03820 [Ruminococcus sp.]|nr:hypothetical protein [Ruminococcus sp.]